MRSTTAARGTASKDNVPGNHPTWRKGLSATAAAVFVLMLLAGCAAPGKQSGSDHVCADKVVQSIATNAAVDGLWKCLTPDFQSKLQSYASAGLINSADDAAFTNPSQGKPSVISVHFVSKANGVDLYTIIVQSQSGAVTLGMLVWVNPADKVDNFGIASPIF